VGSIPPLKGSRHRFNIVEPFKENNQIDIYVSKLLSFQIVPKIVIHCIKFERIHPQPADNPEKRITPPSRNGKRHRLPPRHRVRGALPGGQLLLHRIVADGVWHRPFGLIICILGVLFAGVAAAKKE
jgi:hypothetical protein